MNIALIGAGNVAWHLAFALDNAGHYITEIYSRNPENAQALVNHFYDSAVQLDLNFADSQAELFIIATSDNALEEVVKKLVLPEGAILVHTSGTNSLEALQQYIQIYSDIAIQTGIVYPLQTFSKHTSLDYKTIPFFIEASDEVTEDLLIDVFQSVSDAVYLLDSYQRKILHISAVIACNFTNHFYSIAHDILKDEDLDFELLKPLIGETVKKALASIDPAKVQTGPARRDDWHTTSQHMAYLQSINPDWANLYRLVSENIREKHFTD